MRGWFGLLGVLLGVYLLGWVALAALRGELREWRSYRAVARRLRMIGRRPDPDAEVLPLRRPVEQVAADLRRLHSSFHREGLRFAKYEGCRQAYDRVLAEAADMVEMAHLMEVLPPGAERDGERERVELLLEEAGLLRRPRAA